MPIRPQPRTWFCKRCNWKKTVAPASDALGPGDYFSACPACASPDLGSRKPNLLELALVGSLPFMGRR